MFLFKKNDNIGKYVVVFPHKEAAMLRHIVLRMKMEK